MNKHTPGPWHIEPQVGAGPIIKAGYWNIAEVFRYVGSLEEDQDDTDANARLIAAAPALLEAALAALPEIYHPHDPQAGKAAYEKLQAAIALASGKRV